MICQQQINIICRRIKAETSVIDTDEPPHFAKEESFGQIKTLICFFNLLFNSKCFKSLAYIYSFCTGILFGLSVLQTSQKFFFKILLMSKGCTGSYSKVSVLFKTRRNRVRGEDQNNDCTMY